MKRLFTLITMICALFGCQKAMAGTDSKTFYAKCTLAVAEESTGRGTVYFDDGTTEKVDSKSDTGVSTTVGFQVQITANEGYRFSHFTDQDGKTVEDFDPSYPYVNCYTNSEDSENPTVTNLFAHFVEQGDEVVYTKAVSGLSYATLVLPIETTVSSAFAVYKVVGLDGKTLVLEFIDNTVPANTPVLLQNSSMFESKIKVEYGNDLVKEVCTATNGLLKGVYKGGSVPVSNAEYNNYVLQEQNDVVGFYRVESEMTATDFCAYLQVPAEQANDVKVFYLNDTVTAINAITTGKAEIYDLNGRRLNKLQKGINIVNGVKIIVK